jgi:hypothetical protein
MKLMFLAILSLIMADIAGPAFAGGAGGKTCTSTCSGPPGQRTCTRTCF